MKIGIIVPDRGDRPRLLAHCQRMIKAQTVQPSYTMIMNYTPESEKKDITQRYRRGYDLLRGKRLDAIFFIESDDYYASNYIEKHLEEWEKAGKPEIFGPRETIYYHIRLQEYFTMYHEQRTSAMATIIKPDMNFNWAPDEEPYCDSWLWENSAHSPGNKLTRALFTPKKHLCIGIKGHEEGTLTGGNMHIDRLGHYQAHGRKDDGLKFLRDHVDPESFHFYTTFFAEE